MPKKKKKLKAYCKATTDEERLEIVREMGRLRWAGTTPEQRKELSALAASQGSGRPRSKKTRCPCEAMTLKRARARADIHGTGLGHKQGCSFYRLLPRIAPKGSGQKENGIQKVQKNPQKRK